MNKLTYRKWLASLRGKCARAVYAPDDLKPLFDAS